MRSLTLEGERTLKSLRLSLFAALLLVLAACGSQDDLKPDNLTNEGAVASDINIVDLAALQKDRTASATNLSGARGSQKRYRFDVPEGASNLRIAISGGSGDADLYVKFGSQPDLQDYDCRPYRNGNDEACAASSPRAGTYFILLRGYTAYSGVTIRASYDDPDGGPNPPPPPPPNPGAGNYDIQFVFGSGVSAAQRQLFQNAATRWEEVIRGDLPNTQLNKRAGLCGQGEPAFNGNVDDIVIYANVAPRDGPGNVLASAGPCLTRSGNGLTTYGIMNFDSADSNGPELFETILHEMGHVLGIGTLWTNFGLVNFSGGCPANPRYTGSSARSEWQALGGSGNVPVEADGGPGTRCGHWDEGVFNNELMTGFSEGSANEPLSRLTAGSLQDMGYQVNKGAANPYSLPGCSPSCNLVAPQGVDWATQEILLKPVGVTTLDGTVKELDTH